MKISIAETPEEFRRFCDLLAEYEDDLPPDLRHGESGEERAEAAAHFGPPNAAFLATAGADDAGCVALMRLDEDTAIIKRLYVRHAFRGRGVARLLMDALMERARSQSYRRIVLDTNREKLEAAYKLYLSLGFIECEAYGSVDYACPTFMELRLIPA
jgi:GNAT superfamily N-acetyltransferase